jgi:hypothetical protein
VASDPVTTDLHLDNLIILAIYLVVCPCLRVSYMRQGTMHTLWRVVKCRMGVARGMLSWAVPLDLSLHSCKIRRIVQKHEHIIIA